MARKLMLQLDALTVDSFATGAQALPVGTVHANEAVAVPCTIGYPLSCPATYHTCASFDRGCRAEY
ncbi:hypothetical protein [Longimicrobium sp.]|uniref:hypothetical protein n=1 Tax=Longimicrobium sp. TaxID=2029185 RepID=UPI002E2F7396|nr:hypothetical protein [Longimicrobium sp.]HEX6040683.1 hypothetical protein [Longimicrobium sp.]